MTPRQIDRVAPNLTPKQIVLAWIKEMQARPSIAEYARVTADRPPLLTVYGKVERSVRAVLGRQPPGVINSAVRKAQREAAFLGSLARGCTFGILMTEESFQLKHAVVVFMLDNIRLRLEAGEDTLPVEFEDVRRWFAILHADCVGHRLAVGTIEAEYFDGHRILSADAARLLECRLDAADVVARRLELELDDAQQAATKVAQKLVSRWVQLAKAEAHGAMGQHAASTRLALLAMGG